MRRAEERAARKGKERGDVHQIWEKSRWNQRVEYEGLNVLGWMRGGEVMTGNHLPNTRED